MAREYRVPPTRYLGLPWPEWGETDQALTLALDTHERLICGCGCGQWAIDSRDEAKAERWQAQTDTCYAGAALEEFRENHGDESTKGELVYVTLLPEGEVAQDLQAFDAERAAAEYAEHAARFNTDQSGGAS